MQIAFEYPMQHGQAPIARPHLTEQVRHCVRNSLSYPRQNEPRVIYDLQQCLTHYATLRPSVAEYKSQKQQQPHQPQHLDPAARLASLQGTLPITFRGAVYHIPVRIWVMPYHPVGPPQIFVVPTAGMAIPQRHPNVDISTGQVYLPYLAQWRPPSSTLCEALSATTFAFSANPPVVAQTTPCQQHVQQPHQAQPRQQPRPQSYPTFSAGLQHTQHHHMHHLSQPPPPPRRPQPPPPPPPSRPAHSTPPLKGLADEDDRARLLASLSARAHATLHAHTASVRSHYTELKVRHADLQARASELRVDTSALEALEARQADLKAWHAANVPGSDACEVENSDSSNSINTLYSSNNGYSRPMKGALGAKKRLADRSPGAEIDTALQPCSMLDAQALAAAAAELAAVDTLDLLDDAVSAATLAPDDYVRLVRRVARELFFQRATREALRKNHGPLFVDALPHAMAHAAAGDEPLR